MERPSRAFHHRYALNYVGLRYMNVRSKTKLLTPFAVIMKMLDAIDRGEGPVILGDGSEAFDFVAVQDCGRANVCAMLSEVQDEFYNVGTGRRTSLRDLAGMLIKLTGIEKPIKYEARSQATLVKNRIGCPLKATNDINFTSEIELEKRGPHSLETQPYE